MRAGVCSLPFADHIIAGLIERNMSSYQSGMDSVRNLTGSPIAGLDPHELLDTRWACASTGLGCAAH
jgi:ferredoxin-nitrite reductase